MELKTIGLVNSPYKIKKGSPHQGRFSEELSTIEIFTEYAEALQGIEQFSHLMVIYWMDRSGPVSLKVVPRGRTKKRGLFSTRAPVRPNPLGLCMVELVKREGNILTVKWLDALDESPVLDIKPFVSDIDCL
ncbi:MAG: tRNA (N6-threonylcarbamoyladenosine(37)-N6)-methyltransferase TrmO [Methanobacterium sp.]|jgi:tRNA-Thr(GGU) m(6)t(6)A37 methyltransferase TsaA|nr:tRNA (N6-threonylcarbamoyladenosine(37)-N6)-methyltransferase TrmO [Methanobacterium sp.]